MEKGLMMTGMGMGVVFSVLVIILFATSLLGWMGRTFPALADDPAPQPGARPQKAAPAVGQTITDEEHAAIKAALATHIEMKPDQFDLEIK
jgi:sodium pump decarboxylase gamma subunit